MIVQSHTNNCKFKICFTSLIITLALFVFLSDNYKVYAQDKRDKSGAPEKNREDSRAINKTTNKRDYSKTINDTSVVELKKSALATLSNVDLYESLTKDEKKMLLDWLYNDGNISNEHWAILQLLAVYYWYDFQDTLKASYCCQLAIKNSNKSDSGPYSLYAAILKDMQKIDSSLVLYKEALSIDSTKNKYLSAYEICLSIGNIYSEIKSDFKEALKYYNRCQTYVDRLNKNEIASLQSDYDLELNLRIGNCYLVLRILDKAKSYFKQALNYHSDKSDNANLFLYYTYSLENNLDSMYYYQDQVIIGNASIEIKLIVLMSKLSSTDDEQKISLVLNKIKDLEISDVTFSKSSPYYHLAKAIKNYSLGNKEYEYNLMKAESIAITNHQYDDLFQILSFKSFFYYTQGKNELAFSCLDSAVCSMNNLLTEIVDQDIAKTMIISDASIALNEIIRLGLINYQKTKSEYYLKRILDLSEIISSRTTLNLIRLANSTKNNQDSVSIEIYKLKNAISSINNFLKTVENDSIVLSLNNKKNRLFEELDYLMDRQYVEIYKSNIGEFKPVELENIQQEILNDSDVVIKYILSKDTPSAIVVTKHNISYFSLPSISQIELAVKSLKNYYSFYSFRTEYEYNLLQHHSFQLYNYLLKPIESIIKNKNLIIIPDKILYYLPFEMLISDTSEYIDISSFKDLKFLIKSNVVSYIPSLSLLYYLENRPKSNSGNILLVGKSKFENFQNNEDVIISRDARGSISTLNNLPGVEKELFEISKSFTNKTKVEIALNEEATESFIKSISDKKYDIIHFATHGLVDDSAPQFSALILDEVTRSYEKEDGLLQSFEITSLNLKTNLTVLSACNTGLGKLYTGDGMTGLNQSFFISGSRSLCLTLWSISDESSIEFMRYFYSNISVGMKISLALQKAKIELINSDSYFSPFYWSPYILSGARN